MGRESRLRAAVPEWYTCAVSDVLDGYKVEIARFRDAVSVAVATGRMFGLQSTRDTAYTNDGEPVTVWRPRYVFRSR